MPQARSGQDENTVKSTVSRQDNFVTHKDTDKDTDKEPTKSRQTADKELTTNKNDKEYKNDKEIKKEPAAPFSDADDTEGIDLWGEDDDTVIDSWGGLEKEKWGSMNFKRMMHFGSFRRSGHGANRGETNYSLTDAHIALGERMERTGDLFH